MGLCCVGESWSVILLSAFVRLRQASKGRIGTNIAQEQIIKNMQLLTVLNAKYAHKLVYTTKDNNGNPIF